VPYTDAIEQALLDHVFQDPDFAPSTTLHLGLSSTTPNDAGGNVTEPTTGSYARVAIGAADMGAAAGTAPAAKSNTAAKSFPTATADWDNSPVTHMTLHSASTGGTVYAWAALTASKDVNNGDTASFASGQLTFRLGKGTPG
jgi:hypothetical protein